ncbi:hypothetical protein NLU13_7247 [Sarocladium strictum]|uniref:SUN domain-containing protein n=1 Tax=Sarocladium strictum TaxID=5046 RepID=A0AA39L5M5_SARSR|nr:hypothetical protein NLU13_7247 [Sarocladium strictum]
MRKGNRLRHIIPLMLLFVGIQAVDLPTISHTDLRGPHHAIETGTCEAQTVNYVTHTAASLCLADSPTIGIPAPTLQPNDDHNETLASPLAIPSVGDVGYEASAVDASGPPFMSFEDWKEEMLKRTGQDPQDLRSRRVNEPSKPGDRKLTEDSGNVWGDEEEIALDFGEYGQPRGHNQDRGHDETERNKDDPGRDTIIAYDRGKEFLHRSKDAGKTCKERFSYSSFDAGATILKTGSGTKNPKALLVENKDSYMLLECGRENKFVIIELSDDILLDTVVVANFEFFSSMIRHFRISVSDRYPVKVDKWTELGTFEARNSRDIQAFLVENPQIWARYVRIEFLTHYGNEYYCPVSLIRIHGTRMLDSWKEADGHPGEDAAEDDDREARQCEDSATQSSASDASASSTTPDSQATTSELALSHHTMTSMDLLDIFAATCPVIPIQLAPVETGVQTQSATQVDSEATANTHQSVSAGNELPPSSGDSTIANPGMAGSNSSARNPSSQRTTDQPRNPSDTTTSADKSASDQKPLPDNAVSKNAQASQASNKPLPASSGTRSRGTPTSNIAAASPTVQEGFFNSITKRLVQVESNLTLSMKYIEDQSRHVQEAVQRIELKQSQRISLALDVLNDTVFTELRTMRDQYERLWQTTLQALETQRERNEKDAVALSARLNLLADEVVFQKRMAIAQALLLLSCLFLVIFSRGVPLPYLNHPQHSVEANTLASPGHDVRVGSRHAATTPNDNISRRLPSVRLMTPESSSGSGVDRVDEMSLEIDDGRPESHFHTAPTRFFRPSPPPTTLPQLNEGFDYHDTIPEEHLSRLPASDQHNTRKPLPALPEHPSSP